MKTGPHRKASPPIAVTAIAIWIAASVAVIVGTIVLCACIELGGTHLLAGAFSLREIIDVGHPATSVHVPSGAFAEGLVRGVAIAFVVAVVSIIGAIGAWDAWANRHSGDGAARAARRRGGSGPAPGGESRAPDSQNAVGDGETWQGGTA